MVIEVVEIGVVVIVENMVIEVIEIGVVVVVEEKTLKKMNLENISIVILIIMIILKK